MIEVSKNQPRIAARVGCGGQRDAGPDSRGSLIPFALSCVWTLLSRGKKMVGILLTDLTTAPREYMYVLPSESSER